MKQLVKGNFGKDDMGSYEVKVEEQKLKVMVGAEYPVEKILQPIKEKFIDKVKAMIPGTLDDKLLDAAWKEAVEALSE